MSRRRRARPGSGPRAPRAPLAIIVMLAAGGWGPPASEPEGPTEDPFEQPSPRDPDDAPFMPAPHNQLGQWSAGRDRPLTRGFDDDHHVQLTAIPTYASLRVPFVGRGGGAKRGGGFALELDVRLFRWLFLRAFTSHTIHPAFEESSYDEESGELTLLANAGLIHTTNTGLALVYALDIGRFVPRVDVGAGVMWVRTPDAAQPGQWGGQCIQGGACDIGLACNADDVCRPTAFVEGHAGIGFDVLFARHWAVGMGVRYYALITSLSELPIYIHGSLRLSARF